VLARGSARKMIDKAVRAARSSEPMRNARVFARRKPAATVEVLVTDQRRPDLPTSGSSISVSTDSNGSSHNGETQAVAQLTPSALPRAVPAERERLTPSN